MQGLFLELVDLLLPRACARCGGGAQEAAALCAPCAEAIPRLVRGGCRLCQSPLVDAGSTCGACAREPSVLLQVAAEAPFAGEVAQWVRRMKYPASGLGGLDPRPGAALASLAADAAHRLDLRPALAVPVPIHPRRRRERGFHPAGELARALARVLCLPAVPLALAQVRATASQTGLDRRARRRNVRGAFVARRQFEANEVVMLVDDVVTTGATLAECARAVRRAGARQIVAVCAARTL